MSRSHDPRRPIDRRAEEVAAPKLGLARVDADADPDRAQLRPRLGEQGELGGDRGVDGGRRRRERRHQPIAGRLHDLPAGVLDRGAQDRIVAGKGRSHGLRVLFPEPRAAFDVGEEERPTAVGDRRRGGRPRGRWNDRRGGRRRVACSVVACRAIPGGGHGGEVLPGLRLWLLARRVPMMRPSSRAGQSHPQRNDAHGEPVLRGVSHLDGAAPGPAGPALRALPERARNHLHKSCPDPRPCPVMSAEPSATQPSTRPLPSVAGARERDGTTARTRRDSRGAPVHGGRRGRPRRACRHLRDPRRDRDGPATREPGPSRSGAPHGARPPGRPRPPCPDQRRHLCAGDRRRGRHRAGPPPRARRADRRGRDGRLGGRGRGS